MNVKSILLGSAAGLMAVSGAYAADLPGEAAPAAVDYVKVCDAFGAGFFYIPGSDTCLKIDGRVRASATYNIQSGDRNPNGDSLGFRADARVRFDARTATDIGTVRSFLSLADNSSGDVVLDDAHISVGFLSAGYMGQQGNSTGLFGINDVVWALADQTLTGIAVSTDSIGGGFFAGVGVYGADGLTRPTVWGDNGWDTSNGSFSPSVRNIAVSGIVGMKDQPWGSVDLSATYIDMNDGLWSAAGTRGEVYGVKLTTELKATDALTVRAFVAYSDAMSGGALSTLAGTMNPTTHLSTNLADNIVDVALAASYQVTDPAALYAGIRYQFVDAGKTAGLDHDVWYANAGVDYALAKGLNAQAEVDYTTTKSYDDIALVTRLVRTW